MKLKMHHSNRYGELDINKLTNFENTINAVLPEDYRNFLIKHNGGIPFPNYFKLPFEEPDYTHIHHVYGLNSGPEYQRLDIIYKTNKHIIPSFLISIADDPFGSNICISVLGDKYGSVYFWNSEGIKSERTIFLANSFSQFLNSLFHWDNPKETEIQKAIKNDDVTTLVKLLPINIDFEDENGNTMLEYAAIHNSLKSIDLLHEKGAKLGDALKYAEENAEFFLENQKAVEKIKLLYKSHL